MKKFAKILGFLGFFVTLATAQIGTAWADGQYCGYGYDGYYGLGRTLDDCNKCAEDFSSYPNSTGGYNFSENLCYSACSGTCIDANSSFQAGGTYGIPATSTFFVYKLNNGTQNSLLNINGLTCGNIGNYCAEVFDCGKNACSANWKTINFVDHNNNPLGTLYIVYGMIWSTQQTTACNNCAQDSRNYAVFYPVFQTPTAPNREGYTFLGYSDSQTGGSIRIGPDHNNMYGKLNYNNATNISGISGNTITLYARYENAGCAQNYWYNSQTDECIPCAEGFTSPGGYGNQHTCTKSCSETCTQRHNSTDECAEGVTGFYSPIVPITGTEYQDNQGHCYDNNNIEILAPDNDLTEAHWCQWNCDGCKDEQCYTFVGGACEPKIWNAMYDCDDGANVITDTNHPESYGNYIIADFSCQGQNGQTFIGWTLGSGGIVYNHNDPEHDELTWGCGHQTFKPVFEDNCYEVSFDDETNGGHPSGYPNFTPGTHTSFYKKYNNTAWYSDSKCSDKIEIGSGANQVNVIGHLPWKEHATFTGYYYETPTPNRQIFNASGNLTTGNNSGSDWTITGNTVLYAQYTCVEGYAPNANGDCVGDKIDVKYTCVSPVDGEPDTHTFNDDATYGAAYLVKSVGTGNHNVPCAFTGYELDNDYVWNLQDYSGNSTNPNGEYGPNETLSSADWQYITTTPLTEIEFILDKSLWHLKTYTVEYRCGTIKPDADVYTDSSATYGQTYNVAGQFDPFNGGNVTVQDFLDNNCKPNGGFGAWTFQNWTFTCAGADSGPYNTNDPTFGTWTYDSNNCYFTANWAQTDFVIILDQNGGTGGNPSDYLYTRKNIGVYLDSARTLEMLPDHEPNANPLTPPQKTINITIYPDSTHDGTGASFTYNGTIYGYNGANNYANIDENLDFMGYYQNIILNPEKYIDPYDGKGYITSDGIAAGKTYDENNTNDQRTWVAHWGTGTITLPSTATWAGHDFAGWTCVDDENTVVYSCGTNQSCQVTVSENITCTAQWSVACRSVSFDDTTNGEQNSPTNGGNNGRFSKVSGVTGWYDGTECGGTQITPSVIGRIPTKTNGHFIGYNTAVDGTGNEIFNVNGTVTDYGRDTWAPVDNATLYAQYECDDLYHLNPQTGNCEMCDAGQFYDPGTNSCKTCADILGSNWTSKEGYTWSIDQCFRNCGTDGNDNVEECDAVITPSGHGFEQFITTNGGTGRQISFYGNERQNIYTCRSATGATKCPLGLLNSNNPSVGPQKPMAAAVRFNNAAQGENESRYIIGNRAGGDSLSLADGFAWSQVVGAGQQGPEITTELGTYRYTFITYPADTAPAAISREHQTFAGYGYPETDATELVNARNLTADNADDIIQFAKNLNPAQNNMSPDTRSQYSRNLWPIYTDDPTYTLTYLCNGGETPSTDHQVTGLYVGTQFNLITPNWCTGCYEFTGWWDGSQTITPEQFANFTWNYNSNMTFIAQCAESTDKFIIYNKIPVSNVNASDTTENGNTYVPANGGTPTTFTCGDGTTTNITGQPQLKNSDDVVIGTVVAWCDDNGLNSGCVLPKYLQNTVCTDKNVYAKWECTDPRYHLNETKDDCVACRAGEYWDEDDEVCKSCSALGNGWTSKPGYNQSIDQCYRICNGSNGTTSTSCTSPDGLSYTGFSVSPIVNGEDHQIEFYGNWRNRTNNPELDVCGANAANVEYCARLIGPVWSTNSSNRLMSSKMTFKKDDNNGDAGTRHLVGYTSAQQPDLSNILFVGNNKIWTHIMGPGQYTTGDDNRHYVYAIYPTDTAPNPGDTGARFMGYYDAQNGGVQRVAAALGLDSSNAIAFAQSPLSLNQIGDRILYPQYCENGQEWNGSACIGTDYTVKYICGAHGADVEGMSMENTATYGQSYKVAYSGAQKIAECNPNTGYVLKTNNNDKPVWKFNGDDIEYYTGEEFQWISTISSPTFTAQYDCAAGYTANGDVNDGGNCVLGVFTVTYDCGIGTGGSVPDSEHPVSTNGTYNVLPNGTANGGVVDCNFTGQGFAGWKFSENTGVNTYNAEDTITWQAGYDDETLTAQYRTCNSNEVLVDGVCYSTCSVSCVIPSGLQSNGCPVHDPVYPNPNNPNDPDGVRCEYVSQTIGGYDNGDGNCRYISSEDDHEQGEIIPQLGDCRYNVTCNNTSLEWNSDPNVWACVWPSGTVWTVTFKCDVNDSVTTYNVTVPGTIPSVPAASTCAQTGSSFTNWKDADHGGDLLEAGATNVSWTHEYNATYTPDRTQNIYHAHLNPYSYGQSNQSGTFGDAGVENLWERYGDNWYKNYNNGNLAGPMSFLNTEQLPTRTGGYSFAGYKTMDGYPRLNYADGRWNLMSPTTITDDEEWYAQWTQCTAGQYYLNGCQNCPPSHPNSDPTTATSMSDCYYSCSRCEANGCPAFGGAVCAYADPNSLNLNNGGVYYGTNTCVLLPGNTMPNCPYTVTSCAQGYQVNSNQTACEPIQTVVNYSCGTNGSPASYGVQMFNTATYGENYTVAQNDQNQEIQCTPTTTGYVLLLDTTHGNKPVWNLNYGTGQSDYTGHTFTWQYIFPYGTNPTFTAQYVCDTDNGYHLINGTCQKCPENSYWTGSQCKECDQGYHVNDAGDGCMPNTVNLNYITQCGTSNPQSSTCTFNTGFNLATHSASAGYTFNGWTTNGNTYTGPFNPGQQIQCTAAYLGNAVYTNNATVTITGSCASNDELCPAQLPANANLNTNYPLNPTPNAGTGTCTYHLQCASCIGSNDHDCYTYAGMNSDGTFTVTGAVGNSTVLNNVRCEPATYTAVYKCGAGTPGGSYTDNVTITYNGSYTVLPNGSDGVVTCSKDGEMFNHWAFNLESGRQYIGGDQIMPWLYHGSTVPTFTAQYGPCPEGEVIVDGECKKECIVPCTWQNYPANPAPCPNPPYPAGTTCHYTAGTNPAYGYRPNPSSRLCLDIYTAEQVEAQTCSVDITQDPICPAHYHWNSGTFNCDPDVYTVTLDLNRESYQNNTIVPGSNNVNELKEKWEYGWSKDGGYQFATDSLILNTNTEVPYWTDGTKVFDGYWTTPSGIGYRMVQANGSVSQNGYQLLPATTITSDTTWYARYVDNPGPFTVTFRCDQDGAILNTQNPSFGDYIDVLAAPQSACTNHPGETFNQWRIVANGMLIPAWYNGTSGMYPWQLHEGSQIVPDWRPVYKVTLDKGASDAVNGEVTSLWDAVGIGWYTNSGLTDEVDSLSGSDLPTRISYTFAGYVDSVSGNPRGQFGSNNTWGLPETATLTSNETWRAEWSRCPDYHYYDNNQCKECEQNYHQNPRPVTHEDCYTNCQGSCQTSGCTTGQNHVTECEYIQESYTGFIHWPNPIINGQCLNSNGVVPSCDYCVRCEDGWVRDPNNCKQCIEDAHFIVTLNPHLVNNTQGSYSSPRALYTWHGKGVYLYEDYSQYLMNGNQNPLVSNPQTYATVTFNLNGDGAWLDWENQRYTDPVDIDVPLTYLGFYKSETDSDMVINTNRYIEPAGTQAGKTATANLEWHAHWQPRQIGTVTGSQLPQPSRPGFNFVGWFNTSASNGGTQIYATTTAAQNMTVYARWSDEIYTVNLVSDRNNCQPSNNTPTKLFEKYNVGWNRSTTGTFDRDLLLNDDELPTPNAGYIFDGYYDAQSGGQRVIRSDGRVIQEPNYTDNTHTWYARCVRPNGPFTVTFKCDTDGHTVQSNSVNYGANVTAPTVADANCTKPGHTFSKWKAVVNNENIVFSAGQTYSWGYYSGADFVPNWVLDAPYHVTLDQNGATQYGVTDLYEKYSLWWSLYQNGNSTITQLSGNALPRKTGFNFGGYENANGVTMGTYSSTTGVWTLPLNTTVTGDETWTAIWSECGIGEYWDGYKCYPCPDGFTDNPHAIGIEQCYGNCQYDCQESGCPSPLPDGMQSCTPDHSEYPQWGIKYNRPGATCLPQGQQVLPICRNDIICKNGYDLFGTECRDGRYTITLNSNLYNDNGTAVMPSTLYTWRNHGVYSTSLRRPQDEMTSEGNPVNIPSTYAMVTLNGNGVEFNWHNQYGPQLQDNVDFVFDGFYDITNATTNPVIGIDGYITADGQSIGMDTQSNLTWRASWRNGSVDLPSISRDGYTFDGWWTECNGGTRVSMGDQTIAISGNRTLCAHWSGKSYTVTYNCDSEGGQGGAATDSQLAYQNTTYTVRENFIPCHKDADVSNGTRYYEFENWKFNLNPNSYWPGDPIMWIFNADNPTFNAHYKECPNGWYFDGSCKQCPNGYTSSDIDADSATKCYKTCDVSCTQPTSQCPMNEEGVLTCTYPNNTYPLGKQYSGSDNCIYDGTAPACEPFTIMCKPGYTPDYYLSTDTGTHCTKLAEYEITLDPNLNPNSGTYVGQDKLYTIYNDGVYLDSARTQRMTTGQNPVTDLPTNTAIATFDCPECNTPVSPVSVDLVFNGYYNQANNGIEYITSIIDGTTKGYITSAGQNAGKNYTDSTHVWYAQWSPAPIGNSKWPADPTRTACGVIYGFAGWWTAANGGTVVSPDTPINSNVTWYAHWCESCPASIENGSCSATNCKATITCDTGYNWNADSCACTPTTGLTLTYQPNGGTPDTVYTEDRYFGETFTTRGGDTYTKDGHIIAKWANVGAGGSFPLLAHEYTYDYNGNTTLEPEWKQCTCTFNGNSGVESCDANIVTNNTCTPDVVCKPGYVNGHYTCINEHLETCSAQCDICQAGTYQNGNQCSPCDGNTVSAAGATQCEPCDPGYTANAEHTQCVGNPITINWDENGGRLVDNGICQFCTEGCVDITCESCGTYLDNTLTLANVTHSNPAMQFLGWKLFTGDSTYPAGTNVMCTYDNVGVTSGTSTEIQAQWNECQCINPWNAHVAWCQAWFADGECKYMNGCEDGYEPDPLTVYTPAAVCNPKNYNITYNCGDGIGSPEYLTDSATFDANYTVKGRGTCQMTGFNFVGWKLSANNQTYQPGYRFEPWNFTQQNPTFTAQYSQCAAGEVWVDGACKPCTCSQDNWSFGVASCTASPSSISTCSAVVTCDTGYNNPQGNCNGAICSAQCDQIQSNAIYVCGDDATGAPPATETMNYGATHTVKGQTSCAKSGYTFNGWNFTGTNENYNPGATVQWNYETNQTFTGNWCENCVQPNHGECSLNAGVAGMCSYNCNCNAGYTLVGGVCTAHPVCERSEYNITYQPNGGMNNGVLGQPVIQDVTYGVGFTTKDGTIFTMENSIITAWDSVDGGNYPDLNAWYQYNTVGDTVLDAHWEQCTCTTGNGVSSCTTSSTSENSCACAGECAVRYIDGGCTCNGTTSCTQTCTECPVGYISNADQTECVICPENTYQSGNTCEQCPTGYTSPAGSTSIEDCYNNPISYTVHYSSNNGLDQTETQPVTYGATFTTLGGTTFTYDNHIMTRWNKISGGDYTELLHPYEYGVQEDTFLKAQWAECTCATGNGVSSCTTSSTSENACACTGECAAGYVKGECSCSGNTCTQSCTKCADNQVEINGVCVDCSCSADGNGVVSGCGFVSNENNVCNWGTTTCDTGYNNPGDLVCTDLVHNNYCTATCTLGGSNAVYKCGTGIGTGYSTYVNYGATHTILTNAFVGCYRDNSTFAGWAFNGDNNIYFDNVGATVTWDYTEDKEFEARWCSNCPVVEHGTNLLTIPEPGLCRCDLTCDTGYHVENGACEPNVYPNENGITYKPNGGTPNRNYTQSVTYDAPFTTLDWSVEHYTKAHHILTRWDVESGGAGTFNGGYAALGTEYTYHTDGATVLAADWTECATDEISLNNTCRQCGCTTGTGAASCGTLSTDDDTCTWGPVSCQTGYVTPVLDCLNDTTNCTASCAACGTTQVEVDGTCENCVCDIVGDANGVISGCVFVSNNGNTCNWNPTTCRLGYGNPNLTCDDSGYNNNCTASCTICPAGTYGDNGIECKPCPEGKTSLAGATSIRECFIDPNSCASDEHIEHGECVSNERACSIPDATSAVRIWNPAIGTYGPCTVQVDGCNSGYHVSGNVCVKNTEACTVEHGHGERDWNGTSWGACGDVVCDPGYEPNSDYTACVECSNRRVNGDIAVSGYIYECEIAACMYQGQKYALQNGECVPICENASDETGTKVWDERTKKCIRTCNPGYKMW